MKRACARPPDRVKAARRFFFLDFEVNYFLAAEADRLSAVYRPLPSPRPSRSPSSLCEVNEAILPRSARSRLLSCPAIIIREGPPHWHCNEITRSAVLPRSRGAEPCDPRARLAAAIYPLSFSIFSGIVYKIYTYTCTRCATSNERSTNATRAPFSFQALDGEGKADSRPFIFPSERA